MSLNKLCFLIWQYVHLQSPLSPAGWGGTRWGVCCPQGAEVWGCYRWDPSSWSLHLLPSAPPAAPSLKTPAGHNNTFSLTTTALTTNHRNLLDWYTEPYVEYSLIQHALIQNITPGRTLISSSTQRQLRRTVKDNRFWRYFVLTSSLETHKHSAYLYC